MKRRLFWILLSGVSVACLHRTALAQTAPNSQDAKPSAVEEVVVTAQRRSERLSDVPLSVTAATGEELAQAGVFSPSDLVKVVPGFSSQPSNNGNPVYSIRGVGFFENSAMAPPTVSIYVDQVPLPYPIMAAGTTLDLQRLEVLKGPQGTLFGQNSTGGAVNFIAAPPTDVSSYGGSVEYNEFDQINLEGQVSGALSETVHARLALRSESGGAWQRSQSRPNDELGDRDFLAGRLTLDWDVSSAARFIFTASGWDDSSDLQGMQFLQYSPSSTNYTGLETEFLATPLAPDNSRSADWDAGAKPRTDADFYQISVRGEFDLSPSVSLYTISAYSDLNSDVYIDYDGTPLNNANFTISDVIEAISQEVRLQGSLDDDKVRWLVGVNYATDDAEEALLGLGYIATNNGVGPIRYNNYGLLNNVEAESRAVFGSLEYALTETLSAQVSARYTKQTRDGAACLVDPGFGDLSTAFSLISTTPFSAGDCVTLDSPNPPGPPPYVPVGGFVKRSLDEDNVAWRLNLSWQPNSDVHLYANVTRGYKAGAFSTIPVVFSGQYFGIPQEEVTAYETGFKVSLAQGRAQLAGAVFYYDYVDKQIQGTIPTPFGNLPGLVSVPESSITGAEFDVTLRPISGLTVNGGVTYIQSEVRDDKITSDPFGIDININGYQFPITPEWQGSLNAEYSFPFSARVNGFFGAGLVYRSDTPATFGGGSIFVLPEYTTVDLRAGVEAPDGHWRAEVFGRNVTDELYYTTVARTIDAVVRTTGRPATFGVRVSFSY